MNKISLSSLWKNAFFLLTSLLLLLFTACDNGNDSGNNSDVSIKATVSEVDMWGNLVLDISKDSIEKAGFNPGDILTISGVSNAGALNMPFTNSWQSVGSWGMCLVHFQDEPTLTLALANASFADRIGGKGGDRIIITVKEKGGHIEQEEKMDLWTSESRADYDSDEAFANFYSVECHGMKPGILFRSSNPLIASDNPSRYEYADRLARSMGIKSMFSISQDEEKWIAAIASGSEIGSYSRELYDEGKVSFNKMNVDIFVPEQAVKVGKLLREIMYSEPPYLFFCTHGRDRTGLIAILLQVLVGATYEELEAGYMRSFMNWHRLSPSSVAYEEVHNIIFDRTLYILSKGGDVDIAEMCDMDSYPIEEIMQRLPTAVELYLTERAGLTSSEVRSLKNLFSVE